MKSGKAHVNGLELAYETFGHDGHQAVLLLMGNSAPGVVWPDQFCALLAQCGYFAIRYDQRDTGLSSYLDFETQPYTLHDLVDDAFGLLDELGIETAHFVGLSQGGNIAYLAGLRGPSRVASITSLMSSPDLRSKNDAFTGQAPAVGQLPRPSLDYVKAVIALNEIAAGSKEEIAVRFMENFRLAAGPSSSFDEAFWLRLGRAVADRTRGGVTVANHSRAQIATEALTAADLAQVEQSCLIMHGEMDPIFPPEHARWAASNLKDAKLYLVPKMGHALDPAFIEDLVERLAAFLASNVINAKALTFG